MEEQRDSALFWETLPDNQKNNDQMAALEAIKAESTPEELADTQRDIGNGRVNMYRKSKNKDFLREAVKNYTQGIDIKCNDDDLNSVLYSNRAQAQMDLGNYKSALADAIQATKLNPLNIKAFYRGAKSALELELFVDCYGIAHHGLEFDPNNQALSQLTWDCKKKQDIIAKKAQQNAEQNQHLNQQSGDLAEKLIARKYKFTRPYNSAFGRIFELDEENNFHFPVILIYPMSGMQDLIEDAKSSDIIAHHVYQMFGDQAPKLDWDQDGAYKIENIELYYVTNTDTAMNKEQLQEAISSKWSKKIPLKQNRKKKEWQQVDLSKTFDEVFKSPAYFIPGIPLFMVLSSAQPREKEMLLSHRISS